MPDVQVCYTKCCTCLGKRGHEGSLVPHSAEHTISRASNNDRVVFRVQTVFACFCLCTRPPLTLSGSSGYDACTADSCCRPLKWLQSSVDGSRAAPARPQSSRVTCGRRVTNDVLFHSGTGSATHLFRGVKKWRKTCHTCACVTTTCMHFLYRKQQDKPRFRDSWKPLIFVHSECYSM